ncbi:MAG TPA: 4Fe-4S binding protein [Deltaproteobacteria bacterium]|nr:4Fe-4S binding protein [Deltaproteobacteria bacterium]
MKNDISVRLTDKIFMNGSRIIPELFGMIADDDESELLLAMPGTPDQLAERLGRDHAAVEKMCKALYHKGLAFKSLKGDAVSYKMCRDLVQFHDATILWSEAPKAYHDLWQRFMEEEWPRFAQLFASLLPRPFTRILPVETAVDALKETILDIDSASAMVRNAAVVAVTSCTCRLIAGKCHHTLEACIQIDNAARYTIDRGSGREISKDEALAILRQSEQEGLVHVTINKAHAGHFICNCCACCCQSLPVMISFGAKINDPSRFRAVIDPGRCTSCGACQERCAFKAVEEKDGLYRVLEEQCMGCGVCHAACPAEAISLIPVRPPEFIPA